MRKDAYTRFLEARERWAVVRVKGADTRYRISSEGRIRRKGADLLSPYDNGEGYFKVTLYVRHEATGQTLKVQVYVHRLVALAFVSRPSDDFYQVHHMGTKRENGAVYLLWVTPAMHAKLHGRPPPPALPLAWKLEAERARSAVAPF
jgi:hypothetical protein